MNICEQTKIKILEGASLSHEEQSHLDSCMDCRMTAEFVRRMDELPVMEQDVPASLDKAVLQAASAALPKPRWNPILWKIAVPLAAAFAFAAGVLFYQADSSTSIDQERIAHRNITVKKPVENVVHSSLSENTFEDQVLTLAMEVGRGIHSLPESFDSVSETIDLII